MIHKNYKNKILCILIGTMLVTGCGDQKKTYEEGLEEGRVDGFRAGYYQCVSDYDDIIADEGRIEVYASDLAYLMGFYDRANNEYRLTGDEYKNQTVQSMYSEGYEKGFNSADEQNDY